MRLRSVLALFFIATSGPAETWRFAVSGDSRNCGDLVMPAIAAGVKSDRAAFYWHLGDFRRLSKIDEDMHVTSFDEYRKVAWSDFIDHQLQPFAPVPLYLAIGNHELNDRTRADFLAQFAKWFPEHRTYYHWLQNGVDFIALDNASKDMFDDEQIAWLERVLASDAADSKVKTIVLGMHEALPHSLACDHSMNESAKGEASGSRVYRELLRFRASSGKKIYVIASHAHFWMREPYDSAYWRTHGGVLPGVIVGTAGATRYRLPDTVTGVAPDRARTDVYGYALATVHDDGSITFDFREITSDAGGWCFTENKDFKPRTSSPCAAADAPPGPAPRRQSSN